MPRPKRSDLNENGLTGKEQSFCDALLSDPAYNMKRAAIASGTPPGTANVVAYQMHTRERVAKYLLAQKRERAEEVRVCKNYVLERMLEIDNLDIADILEDDMEFLPISEWPSAWRRSISAIDVVNINEGRVSKVKWPDKVKNLEMLGKHIDVGAWVKEDGGLDDVAQPLNISFTVAEPVDDINVTRGKS